jgi:hypothetical protein
VYVNSATYAPSGAPAAVAYGNGIVNRFGYNSRLQPPTIQAAYQGNAGQVDWQLNYNWGTSNNNGNLQSLTSQGFALISIRSKQLS